MAFIRKSSLGRFAFAAFVALLAGALYALTAAGYCPYGPSSHYALLWAGTIPTSIELPHELWGVAVRAFGGRFIALGVVSSSIIVLSAAYVARRWLPPALAFVVAVTVTFLPPVWFGAIAGKYYVFYGAILAVAGAVASSVAWHVLVRRFGLGRYFIRRGTAASTISSLSLALVCAAVAVWSLGEYPGRAGSAASVYARGILDEARGKWLVLDGTATDQFYYEARPDVELLSVSRDAYYTECLVRRVKALYPDDPAAVGAAKKGAAQFADWLVKTKPDKVHVMAPFATERTVDERLKSWNVRWEGIAPLLALDREPFAEVGRRAFGREGCGIGERLVRERRYEDAWALFSKIVFEVDRNNPAALSIMRRMLKAKAVSPLDSEQDLVRALCGEILDGQGREVLK